MPAKKQKNIKIFSNELSDSNNQSDYINNMDRAYWKDSLFSKVYLKQDLKKDFPEKWKNLCENITLYKEGESSKSGFSYFYKEFRKIAENLRNFSNKRLSETDTITKIITPLLNALGWYDNCSNNVEEPYSAETSFVIKSENKKKTYITDMLLVDYPQEVEFISNNKDSSKRKREAQKYCIVPLEAKYWNRILDKEKNDSKEDKRRANKKPDDTSAYFSFNEQILNYMNILQKKWGIITDGNVWRLVNKDISQEFSDRCFEFKIQGLLEQESKIDLSKEDKEEFLENAKYFYLFFGKPSYVEDKNKKIFLDEILSESRKYIDDLEEDLKDRFISAMNITCNGFLKIAQKKETIKKPTSEDLALIRTVAESHLFNILFIKSCETRDILPINAPKYEDISLTVILNRIADFDPEKYTTKQNKKYMQEHLSKALLPQHEFKPDGISLYKNLIRLTEVIHEGTSEDRFGFEIKGFKESIFSDKEWSFAEKHHLNDESMIKILFELGYSKAKKSSDTTYKRIPYNYFTPRQLGSIFESFLEYKLDIAKETMVFLKKGKHKQWIKLTANIQKKLKGYEPIVNSGQAFFTPNNSERKSSGSYYTPDYIVQYIVKEALTPLCRGKSSKEILEIKVCDPAMGSGHFLIGALNFLTTAYLKSLENEKLNSELPTREEAKRTVLSKCIFGVDINPRAVKLAKMSLWLESARKGKKLEHLDNQLKQGNSLIHFDWLKEFPDIFKNRGFSFILGNPPYLSSKEINIFEGHLYKVNFNSAKSQYNLFELFIEKCFVDLLDERGYLTFLLPDTFLFLESYNISRNFVFQNISSLIYWGDTDFDNVKISVISPIIIKGEKFLQYNLVKAKDGYRTEKRDKNYEQKKIFPKLTSLLDEFEDSIKDFNKLGSIVSINRGEEISKAKLYDKGNISNTSRCLVASDISEEGCILQNKYWIHNNLIKKNIYEGLRVVSQRIRHPNLKRRIVAGMINKKCISIANTAVTHGKKDKVLFAFALYNSKLFNYYFYRKFIDVSVNEAKLKSIPIPDLNKKENISLVNSILNIISKNEGNLFYNDQFNYFIYKLYKVDKRLISEINYTYDNNSYANKVA